jgi:hypothetical protein
MKRVSLVVDTSFVVKTGDHHGNVRTDTLSVKLHYINRKLLAAAELTYFSNRIFFCYFNNNKPALRIENREDGEIIEQVLTTNTPRFDHPFDIKVIGMITRMFEKALIDSKTYSLLFIFRLNLRGIRIFAGTRVT